MANTTYLISHFLRVPDGFEEDITGDQEAALLTLSPQDWHTLRGQAYGKTVNRGLAFQVHSVKAVLRDPSDRSVECPLHTLSRPASFQEAHGGDVRSQCPGSDPGVVSEPLACVTWSWKSFTSLPGSPFLYQQNTSSN